MSTLTLDKAGTETSLRDWQEIVRSLEEEITTWCMQKHWAVTKTETQVTDVRPQYGSYQIPSLSIDTPDGRLILEPLPHAIDGTGLVRLYTWPTLFRVRLLYRAAYQSWEVLTDSGIPIHEDWSGPTFLTLAHDLLNADY